MEKTESSIGTKLYWALVVLVGAGLVGFGAPSWAALIGGLVLALASSQPRPALLKPLTTYVLQAGVIALGAGMNLTQVFRGGLGGALITTSSVLVTLGLGLLLGRFFKTSRDTTLLVAVGTAICGGSAIAAVSSVIKPKAEEVSIALAVVFVLNALGLFIFPPLGHLFDLSQSDFGRWAALAIHDTSSVVGAGLAYGHQAAQVATTTKLARALWIVPLTIGIALYRQRGKREGLEKVKWPWFILGFLVAAALVTWVPSLATFSQPIVSVGRHLLVLALYLIGLSLSREQLRVVGARPLLLGVTLWVLVGIASLPLATMLAG